MEKAAQKKLGKIEKEKPREKATAIKSTLDKAASKKEGEAKPASAKMEGEAKPASAKMEGEARAFSLDPVSDPCALAAEQLLRKLRSGVYWAAGKFWRVSCRRIYDPAPASANPFVLMLSVKGIQCHIDGAELSLEALERILTPFRWDEIPVSLRAGILELYLTPMLQPLFNAPCAIYEAKNTTNLFEESASPRFCLSLEASVEGEGKDGGQPSVADDDFSWGTKTFRLHCSAEEGEVLSRALKPRRHTRYYPPSLMMEWSLYSGGASLSLEELRSLERGDIILLDS